MLVVAGFGKERPRYPVRYNEGGTRIRQHYTSPVTLHCWGADVVQAVGDLCRGHITRNKPVMNI